ncbi:MAG: HIT domain-containing protein [Puniceicoccales bacterium]|jgi:diadenosine tetraphosphate (Ap4A) HIT family hydrolase|nr:HIT domain-containing protein [Puniceicoccales bacterium]
MAEYTAPRVASFTLLEQFWRKLHVCDFKLSRVLLNDTKLPWLFLIPMRENVVQMNKLARKDQKQLMLEICAASDVMERIFPCTRLNIAAIGNKTPQLHIHVICRTEDDEYWPETVWQYSCEKLTNSEYEARCENIRNVFAVDLCRKKH